VEPNIRVAPRQPLGHGAASCPRSNGHGAASCNLFGHPAPVKIPRAVAVVVDGPRVLMIKRYLRHESSAVCVMCEDSGESGPACPGHHYSVLPGGGVEEGETAEVAALRELFEESELRATIERQLWTGSHNGRPASYFLMADVIGTPVLSGPEAVENSPDNSFELLWATAEDFESLSLHPADIRNPLAALLTDPLRQSAT
jgi:ADP-ribose pyrophosphatase YjhB (NUDIX family)